jgi:hypothetical protein
LNPGQPGVLLKAKSLTRAMLPLFRCSTWLSYGPYGSLRTGVEKEFGGFSQLAVSASSNQPFELVVWDALSATVFLQNKESSISLFYAPF